MLTKRGLEPRIEKVNVSVKGVGGDSVEVPRANVWPIAIAVGQDASEDPIQGMGNYTDKCVATEELQSD
eukprot:3397320-Amphidinium_carterae.1